MDLQPYVENIQHQLLVAAEAGGDDARALAQRLLAPLDAAIRLALQDALAVAAEEITCELAPGSVELRLRGGELEFAVAAPAVDAPDDLTPPPDSMEGDDGGMSRINLRMPDSLKVRVEQAAAGDTLSVNAWLVRAATAALDRVEPARRVGPNISRRAQKYTGWAR